MVLDLVHPSIYPLVYGRSRVFNDETVGVDDAIDKWAGKGEVIPSVPQFDHDPRRRGGHSYNIGGLLVPPSYWSEKYQWLPSNVQFLADGSVKFTSYVNNLHPSKYRETYRTIERLIETTLPIWDQCIPQCVGWKEYKGAGRLAPRFPKPEDPK